MEEKFDVWKARHTDEIDKMKELLKIQLSDEGEALWQALRNIEAYYGRVQYMVSQADAYLDEAKCQALEALQRQYEKLAAYEKKTMVDAGVSDVRMHRDALVGMVESIKQRIMLGQSRLKYLRALPDEGN